MAGVIGRLRRAARWTTKRAESRVLILLYHRIAELRSDPWLLGVTPRHFAEHLEVLRRRAQPLQLRQLSQALLDGGLPDHSVIVTFDDGYADNLHHAKPTLERYDVPATIFLTTGYVGHEREFWWDELERLLLQPDTLPETLRLSINGGIHEWKLGRITYRSEDASRHPFSWRTMSARRSRLRLYRSVWELMYRLTEDEKVEALGRLATWSGVEPAVRSTHRPLSPEETVLLASGDLIEIGAHTVTHPALSELPTALQREEIRQSKAWLEEILSLPVTSFSYPHGSFSAETTAIVRETGFDRACSISPGVVCTSSDFFELPRFQVQDWSGREFARRLSWWLSG